MNIKTEIERASQLGQKLEDMVVAKGQCTTDDRTILLIGYWALLFDYHKSIMILLSNEYYGGAFALVRPVVEAAVRAHLVLMCSGEDLLRIREDEYRVNFNTVGKQIDESFHLGGLFERLLNDARDALHSYTHSGIFQIARRFVGRDLKPHYREGEMLEIINTTTSAAFMVTSVVTKIFGFEDEWKAANSLYSEWGKHPHG